MFTFKTRSLGSVVTMLVLLMALLIPSAALAEGEEPPVPDAPVSEVTQAAEEVQAPAETQESVPAGELPTEEVSATEEVAPTEETAPVSEDAAAVVEVLAETESVLLDQDGEAIPLASEAAAEALTATDPWFDVGGGVIVGYSSTGLCAAVVTECNASATPIQAAINDVRSTGKVINIEAGSYYENIQITHDLTLQGAGRDLTFIYPANSDPDDVSCPYGSCPSATNTVIWITADNVAIYDLTVDGNNPFVDSNVVVGGEDIDAHNGILSGGLNLTVEDVTVRNVWQRGIQFGKAGGSANINNNTVENVQGSPYSIAIGNWYGSATITNNYLSHVGDGVSSNWGTGLQVLNNTISDMNTGIHTDNTGGMDVISGNTISNGKANSYGIFVFAPYKPVTVENNDITGVDYGLTVAGNGFGAPLNTISFDGNTVQANVAGVYVTTDVWWYFASDVSASFTNNIFTGGAYGIYLESQGDGDPLPSYYTNTCGEDCVLSVYARDNYFSGQTEASVFYATGALAYYNDLPAYNGIYNVDAINNCWGTTDPVVLDSMMAEGVLYDPWLPDCQGGGGDEGAGGGDDDTAAPLQSPVTGGGLANVVRIGDGGSATLDCTAHDGTVLELANGDHVLLPCPISGEATLHREEVDTLPSALDEGMSYISGMHLGLAPDHDATTALAATIGLHFVIPAGQATEGLSVLHLDGGVWEDLGGLVGLDGYFEAPHAQTGIYLLVSH